MMQHWTTDNMPDQSGKTIIVTGANSGLGFETTKALAEKGATVIMACRNMDKGDRARQRVIDHVPDATLELMALDLSDLSSVRDFAATFQGKHERLDVLINNAGLMGIPRRETVDGFEMQLGVNHLGHFALTGLLMERLLATPDSRVISVSSFIAYIGEGIHLDDLNMTQNYTRYGAYAQSKLANVLFAYELDERLKAAGADVRSIAAHPGYSDTSLQDNSTTSSGNKIEGFIYGITNRLLAQSQAKGALPQLYAATAPEAKGGTFYGPNFLRIRGYPTQVRAPEDATNTHIRRRLWESSQQMTGVRYPLDAPAAETP